MHEGFDVHPHTDYRFAAQHQRIVFIGLAAGLSPNSTRHGFPAIQRHVQQVVSTFQKGGPAEAAPPERAKRFRFYDHLIWYMLAGRLLPGKDLFDRLLGRNDLATVFHFFAARTRPAQEAKILWSLRSMALFKAFWMYLKRKNG